MKIGDKVVCVDDSPCRCGNCGRMPLPLKSGSVYVIDGFYTYERKGILCFTLIGVPTIKNHFDHNGLGVYASYRFRLLDELKAEAKAQQSQSAKA
jgi:hypothetical protein